MSTQADRGPNLLLDWREQGYAPNWLRAGTGSFAVHIVLIAFLLFLLSLPAPAPQFAPQILSNFTRVTPLVDPPPFRLTQKDPSRGKPSTEVDVENLLPHPPTRESTRSLPAPSPKKFEPPTTVTANKTPTPQPKLSEPPPVQAQLNVPTNLPAPAGTVNPPAPRIEPQEQPKLAFENPGQAGTPTLPSGAIGRIAPPKTTVDEAIKSVARGAGQGLSVGDIEAAPNLPDSLAAPGSPGSVRSSLDLLSDPMGADFKPYLIRVLSIVRRNWLAIIPESARLGRRGVVTLQFIADRNGQVPKLVIASPSGADALDRAAVAGVSASVPLPPLPSDFKGNQVRLQLSFKYNVK